MTSSSSPVSTGSTSVCRSPPERATIRSVTRFTGREMDRAKRRISRMETASPQNLVHDLSHQNFAFLKLELTRS